MIVSVLILLVCIISLSAEYSTNLLPINIPSLEWVWVTCSSSGQYVAAVANHGGIYISNNYGYEWTNSSAPPLAWNSITSSSSGQYLLAANLFDLYHSNDYGANWNKTSAPVAAWYVVASSSSGQYLYGVAIQGQVHYSNDYGNIWYPSTSETLEWESVACSASGQYVVAVVSYGRIYNSNNYGHDFNTSVTAALDWVSVASDASGQLMTAVVYTGGIYISHDYGITWVKSSAPTDSWVFISSSETGQYLYALSYSASGGFWYSDTYGNTWNNGSANVNYINRVATSGSGQFVYVTGQVDLLYANYYNPTSMPSSAPSFQPIVSPSSQPSSSPSIYLPYSYALVEMNDIIRVYGSIVSSSSGQFIYSYAQQGIFRSTKYGNNWDLVFVASITWNDITCSASGQLVYAVVNGGNVYNSSDYGVTWDVTSAPQQEWVVITTSGSGQFVYAGNNIGNIFYSHNYGLNWSRSSLNASDTYDWGSIDTSESGQYVTVGSIVGCIFVSNDYGLNFNLSKVDVNQYRGVSVSSSGQYQVAASEGTFFDSFGGSVIVSSDYGVTWTLSNVPTGQWVTITCDGTGQYIFAAMDTGQVYVSVSYGYSWSLSGSPLESWRGLTVSSDGQYLAAVVNDGGFYTNHYNIPSSRPSSPPSSCPSSKPSELPSAQPSSMPSKQPHTSYPTSNPTSVPTTQPSGQPSSYPTYSVDTYDKSATVLATEANVSYVFNNLGCGTVAFLSATLLVSYLDSSSSGYVAITIGRGDNTLIVSNCAPTELCGQIVCAVNINVTSVMTCEGGGSVYLTAGTVNASHQIGVDTLCTYQGTPGLQFAMNYIVSVTPQPTASPTLAPVIAGAGNFVFEASPSTPFYVIVVLTLVFIALGVFIVRSKDKSNLFSGISLTSTCIDMAMVGYHAASEIFYIIILFDENLKILAILIIIIRLSSIFPAIYCLLRSVGPVMYSSEYNQLIDKSHLYTHASIYSMLVVLMMLEQTLIRYFPWIDSSYTKQTRGFPDSHLFKICTVSRLIQLLAALAVQVIAFGRTSSYDYHSDDGSSQIAFALVLLYLISSVLSLTMIAVTNLIRFRAGDVENNSTVGTKSIDNPIHSVDGTGKGTQLTSLRTVNNDIELSKFLDRITYLEEREVLLSKELVALQQKESEQEIQLNSVSMKLMQQIEEGNKREKKWSEQFVDLN